MKKINPAHIQALITLTNNSPYFQLLSMRIGEIQENYCLMYIDLAKKHLNPFGGVHGGLYASAIDSASYCSVYCSLEENKGLITLDLSVDNLSTISTGTLVVEGRQIKSGKTICVAESTIRDESGKLLAHGKSKQLVTDSLQTLKTFIHGNTYIELPPKFIE